jgi:hypothetical protein
MTKHENQGPENQRYENQRYENKDKRINAFSIMFGVDKR